MKNELRFERGERRIVNGKEMAYHGSFTRNDGTYHDFVMRTDIFCVEYHLFSGIEENENRTLNGKVVSVSPKSPLSWWGVGNPSCDLYARGVEILKMGEAA